MWRQELSSLGRPPLGLTGPPHAREPEVRLTSAAAHRQHGMRSGPRPDQMATDCHFFCSHASYLRNS